MPAILIGKDSNGNYTYKDAYTGKATDQLGNKLKSVNSAIAPTNTAVATENNIQDTIKAMKQAQINANVAALAKSRDTALSNLSAERRTIEPRYQEEKNKAGVQAKQTAQSFAEYMAQRGGGAAKSGIAGQGVLLNNLGLQNTMGALSEAEANALADVARRQSDVQNAYESDVAAARAGAEAQAMQMMINQMNTDRQYQQAMDQFNKSFGIQEAGVTGLYNGNQTFAAQQAAIEKALQEGQLMGTYNGQSTLAKTAQDLGQSNWQKEFEATQAQRAFENAFSERQLAASMARASSGGGGGGSLSSQLSLLKYQNELASQQALARSMQGLQGMASDGATRSDILKFIYANAGDLNANGVNVQDLYNLASNKFTWDKNANGTWYDTTAK